MPISPVSVQDDGHFPAAPSGRTMGADRRDDGFHRTVQGSMTMIEKRSRAAGWWFTTLVVVGTAACTVDVDIGTDELTGSGVREARVFDLAGFDRLDASHTFAVEVTVDPEGDPRVEITADDNLFDEMEVEVRDSTLHLGFADGVNVRTDEPPRAGIVVPALRGVDGSGASTITVTASETAVDDVELSGASSCTIDGVEGASISIQLSGASRATVRGSTGSANLDVSGASTLTVDGLTVGTAQVDVSGASRVDFGSLETVTGQVSGASTVSIEDTTDSRLDVSGASTVRRRP